MKTQHIIARVLTLALSLAAVIPAWGGSIARLVYDGIAGTAVSALTNAVIFPNQPTFREQLDDFTPAASGVPVRGLQAKDNTGSNFGAYVRGYLEAPETGDYRFFIASDDASELWLSLDETAGKRRRIAFESAYGTPLFSGDRMDQRRSDVIGLVRGRKYLLEVLHKQGTGASGLLVGWQRPDGAQEVIPARHLAQHPLDPYLGRSEASVPPSFNTMGLNGGDLPATLVVREGDDLTAELDVIAAQPTTIRWTRGGNVEGGEDLSFLALRRVSAAWHGQVIQATVANAFGELTSTASVLSVTPDTTPPTVLGVDHRGNPNEITVFFSEPVAAGASSPSRYELSAVDGAVLPIAAATLSDDGRSVRLAGSFQFAVNHEYQLTVRDIDDRAATPNRLSLNPITLPFRFSGDFLGPIDLDRDRPLAGTNVVENQAATLEVFPVGAKPWRFQWSRNGVAIPGANERVLRVTGDASSAGSYQVTVSNDFSSVTSASVPVSVIPDTTSPRLVTVVGLAGVNTVRLSFDEALAWASATNVLNYLVEGAVIQRATLSPDGRTVLLNTGPLTRGRAYLVTHVGLRDRSVAGNPGSGTGSFLAEVDYAGEVVSDAPVRYWRFNEEGGTTVASLARGVDSLATAIGTLVNLPALGQPSLLPGAPGDGSIRLAASASQRMTVPNGSDINATAGPWAKRTIEFWFRASSFPAPDATGLAATAGLWEEGAATRSIAVYLWRDPANPNPSEAELVFHAYNDAGDGPGSPFGIKKLPPVIARRTVVAQRTYHVVAVLDGDKAGTTGNAILYLNGEEAARSPGAGQIYNHTGDIQVGRGNAMIHTGESGDLGYFDGLLDELAVFNSALSPARVAAHYRAGIREGAADGSSLSVARVDTRGNPNRLYVTFSQPVHAASVTDPAHFALASQDGQGLPIADVSLLAGDLTAQVSGSFGLQPGKTYQLSIRDIAASSPASRVLTPNPTIVAVPFAASGAVGIGPASDLSDRVGSENQPVRFAVTPTGSGPFLFQWLRNGVALAGETGPEIVVTTTAGTVGDYAVEVRNDFSLVTSPTARLSIDTDLAPPRLLASRALAGSLHRLTLEFEEPLDVATATDPSRYDLGPVAVLSASLDAAGRTVTLRTAPLSHGQPYTLRIDGLRDRSTAGNVLKTSTVVVATIRYVDEVLADRPVRFWPFDEAGGTAAISIAWGLDAPATATATYVNGPRLGVAGLVPNHAQGTALRLEAASSQRVTVPNGLDLNTDAGPWAKRTIQFWFRAHAVPPVGATGLAATAGLWEEGGANRSIGLYLWRDPSNATPNEADLVFHAVNNVADGLGSPYGLPSGSPVFTRARIVVGATYHVVAVFDGDASGLAGSLVLHVNGVEVGRATGLGQVFNHTADIQVGRGNALTHDNSNGDWGFFDGVMDELAVFNTALSPERAAQLYAYGLAQPVASSPGVIAGIQLTAGKLTLTWDGPGQLAVADSPDGTFVVVPGARSPHTEATQAFGNRFYRLVP